MTEFKIMFLGCIIGRRGIANTASSGQNHYLKIYLAGIVLFALTFILAARSMGEEIAASAGPQAAAESASPNIAPPMTDIHDILPPVSVGIDSAWLVPAMLTLTAVMILAAAWWRWNKRKKARVIETIVPELPPEMIARRALDEIDDVRRLDGKTFYYRLSAILRQYVFGRFTVGAPEMTTEEFIPCIDGLQLDHDLAQRLKRLCRAMDPVKFGAQTVMEKQMEKDLFFAREFVRKTTQQIDVDSKSGGGEQNNLMIMNG